MGKYDENTSSYTSSVVGKALVGSWVSIEKIIYTVYLLTELRTTALISYYCRLLSDLRLACHWKLICID